MDQPSCQCLAVLEVAVNGIFVTIGDDEEED
jgi:hypothetical protein